MSPATGALLGLYIVYFGLAAAGMYYGKFSLKALKVKPAHAPYILASECVTALMWIPAMVLIEDETASLIGTIGVVTLILWLLFAVCKVSWLGYYTVVPAVLFGIATVGGIFSHDAALSPAWRIVLLTPHALHRTIVDIIWAYSYQKG